MSPSIHFYQLINDYSQHFWSQLVHFCSFYSAYYVQIKSFSYKNSNWSLESSVRHAAHYIVFHTSIQIVVSVDKQNIYLCHVSFHDIIYFLYKILQKSLMIINFYPLEHFCSLSFLQNLPEPRFMCTTNKPISKCM